MPETSALKKILIVFLILTSPAAFACRCITPTLDESYDGSETVVIGRVLDMAPLPDYDGSISFVEVSDSWKLETLGTIAVISVTNCSFAFEKNKKYLIFANSESYGLYSTDKCAGTKLLENDSEVTEWLEARDKLPNK